MQKIMLKAQLGIAAFLSLLALVFIPGVASGQSVTTSPVGVVSSPAAPVGWSDLSTLFTPELSAALVLLLAGSITPALTTWAKQIFKTNGDATKTVSYVVSALVSGLVPFASGIYGYTVQGLIYALSVSVIRSLLDQKKYEANTLTAKKAARVVLQEAELTAQPYTAGDDQK